MDKATPIGNLQTSKMEARKAADESTLDDLLEDTFGSDYLLRFAEAEFSSENVAFLLLLRKLFAVVELEGASFEPSTFDIAQQLCTLMDVT